VAKIVVDVAADTIDDNPGESPIASVDEVSYRKGRRDLTVVADHDRSQGALEGASHAGD
jgi:hypothetical protein